MCRLSQLRLVRFELQFARSHRRLIIFNLLIQLGQVNLTRAHDSIRSRASTVILPLRLFVMSEEGANCVPRSELVSALPIVRLYRVGHG